MIAALRRIDNHGVVYQALVFCCPGCVELTGGEGLHLLPVNTTEQAPSWTFDGNLEAPTLSPSIRSHVGGGVCHSFLTAGRIEYLSDCTHSLAGQTVALPDLPDWFD